MSAATEASAPISPKHGVVRGTLQYAGEVALGVYSQAEQISVVKSTLDLAKPLVPVVQPVVARVVAAADPWVDSVDTVVTGTLQTMNTKVVEPVGAELKHRYENLVDMSDYAVDVMLPEQKEAGGEHSKTLIEVSSKAQKRVMKRLENQWNDARAFSSGTLKQIIHVDLIDTAANGYTVTLAFVQNNAAPIITDLTARGTAIAESTYAAAESTYLSMRDISAEKSKQLLDSIRELSYATYNDASKFASSKAEEYRVPEMIGKAKEISLGEVSELVLVTLRIKEQNEQFVIAQYKLFDLFRTILGLDLAQESRSKPANAPAQKMTEVY